MKQYRTQPDQENKKNQKKSASEETNEINISSDGKEILKTETLKEKTNNATQWIKVTSKRGVWIKINGRSHTMKENYKEQAQNRYDILSDTENEDESFELSKVDD